MKKVEIYTDGACSGNPGPGGYAAILVYKGIEKEIYGAEANTTNNRMELMGAIIGLEAIKEPCEVIIFTDSKYVVDAINKGWLTSWLANNWRKSDKKPVANRDLWERLIKASENHRIYFTYVAGHSGDKYNERCDALAVQARLDISEKENDSSNKTISIFDGAHYVGRQMDKLDMWDPDFMEDMYPGGVHCSDDM